MTRLSAAATAATTWCNREWAADAYTIELLLQLWQYPVGAPGDGVQMHRTWDHSGNGVVCTTCPQRTSFHKCLM